MAKSQQSFNKSEKEKAKQKKRKEKEERKAERKSNQGRGGLDNMIAYVDENGMITSTPPDPSRKKKVIADNIQIAIPKEETTKDTAIIRTGIVTFFNETKGFGFIKDAVSQESIFTHINDHLDTIKENNKVTFMVEKGMKGLKAIEVKLLK